VRGKRRTQVTISSNPVRALGSCRASFCRRSIAAIAAGGLDEGPAQARAGRNDTR
jgi:hypothetical protein